MVPKVDMETAELPDFDDIHTRWFQILYMEFLVYILGFSINAVFRIFDKRIFMVSNEIYDKIYWKLQHILQPGYIIYEKIYFMNCNFFGVVINNEIFKLFKTVRQILQNVFLSQ